MPTTNYLWDPLNDSYLMETDDSGATTAVYTQEPAHYGGLVSQYQASVASYFHQDNLGSTRVLTDDAGTATDAFAYDAWGMGIARTGSTETAFQWIGNKGYYFDYEQELYHVRVRSYRPISSRWMTLDPLLNMRLLYYYTYSNNSPTAAIDPSGYKCETIDANKVRYVPGRGEFTSVAMRTGEPEDDVDPTGLDLFSDFKATWKGYESVTSNAFFDNPGRKSCCCCREVGFIQIVQIKGIRGERKRDAIYSGALDITWNYGKSHSWKIDGGIPYPFGEKSRPCSVYSDKFLKSQYPNAIITDVPGAREAAGIPYLLSPIQEWDQSFEACAVCLRGKEAADRGSLAYPSQGRAVYGCIRWSQRFVLVNGKYLANRMIQGASNFEFKQVNDKDIKMSLKFTQNDSGLPPSENFKRIVGAASGNAS